MKPFTNWRCLLGSIALLVVAGCSDPFDTNEDDLPQARLEALGRFKLPANAAEVRSRKVGFQDSMVWATFTMPADQMDAFLSSTVQATPTAEMLPAVSSNGPAWWKPGTPAKSFRAGAKVGAGYQAILIDQTDPATYRVWVETMNP